VHHAVYFYLLYVRHAVARPSDRGLGLRFRGARYRAHASQEIKPALRFSAWNPFLGAVKGKVATQYSAAERPNDGLHRAGMALWRQARPAATHALAPKLAHVASTSVEPFPVVVTNAVTLFAGAPPDADVSPLRVSLIRILGALERQLQA